MGTVRGSSGKHGLNLIKMRQEVQDQKTELESQQNALSQAQELCSVNSVFVRCSPQRIYCVKYDTSLDKIYTILFQ